MSIKQLLARIEYLEKNSRFIHEALEMAVSLGDFQENVSERHNTSRILQEAEKRIRRLIPFEVCAIYLVNEEDSDITLSLCSPLDLKQVIEDEVDFMTEKGLFAWALREKRGIIIKGKDQNREFLFHQIATYSQIKGLFVGLLPDDKQRIPDASRSILSLILLNAANSIENLTLYKQVLERNTFLEKEVEKRSSELVNYERRLQRVQKMEAIGTLAGGVAHDLNNILSGLVSYPELLLLDVPEDSPLRGPLQTIIKSGEKAAAIVHDLLTLARRGVSTMEAVDLNHIAGEYLSSPEFNKLKAYHPKIEIETKFEKDLSMISGSAVHLSKTIMNLVSNAAEAIPGHGKIVISTANRYLDYPIHSYDYVKEGNYVALTVSDTGTGISAGDMERIFEPFYTKKVMGRSGTGLGMAVVWGTVKDHNGYVDVQTSEGSGTSFTLLFPVTKENVVKSSKVSPPEDIRGNGESILIVDDIEDQRLIASMILTKLGYSVASVSSGEKAVEYVRQNPVDLLILDMIMPQGIDGLETYSRILKHRPGQKAILVSGFSESVSVRKAQDLGAGAYVRKPYSLKKIGLAVKTELGSR